jgi:uncharacterized protein (TIGR02271 family)
VEHDFTTGNLRRLSDTDYTVADNEPDVRGWTVIASDGREIGDVDDLIIDTDTMKVRFIQLDDVAGAERTGPVYADMSQANIDPENKRVIIPGGDGLMHGQALRQQASQPSATASTHSAIGATGQARTQGDDVQRLTRAEEEVRVGKREVQAGEVRVGKHVETEHRHEDVHVMREQIHVERRPVTDGHAVADIRASDQEIRVPIYEEEVVVEKRPVLKEELVISKEQVQDTRPVDIEVRREEFDIRDERGAAELTDERTRRGER